MSEPTGSVSTAFLGRLAARARLRRWSRTRAVVVLVAVLAVVGLVAWVVLASSLLAVRTIEVRGVDAALAAQVRARADDQVGTPLARVDLSAVQRSVASVTGVTDVVVSRDWPSTLRIEAVARRPAAVTAAAGGGFDVVDDTGVVLSTTPRPPSGLPLVVVGDGLDAQLTDGLTVLRSVPRSVRAQVTQVDVRSGQDVEVHLDHGVRVDWGSADQSAEKAQVLAVLLKQHARVYDVSAPDLPTTRQ